YLEVIGGAVVQTRDGPGGAADATLVKQLGAGGSRLVNVVAAGTEGGRPAERHRAGTRRGVQVGWGSRSRQRGRDLAGEGAVPVTVDRLHLVIVAGVVRVQADIGPAGGSDAALVERLTAADSRAVNIVARCSAGCRPGKHHLGICTCGGQTGRRC